MSEDDFVNTLEELAELKVTVPTLLETWADIVVCRLEKMKEGKVTKMARNLVIKWKRVVIEYESPVDNLEAQFGQQLNIMTLSGMTHRDQCEKYKSILDNILTARTILSGASGASSRPSSMKM